MPCGPETDLEHRRVSGSGLRDRVILPPVRKEEALVEHAFEPTGPFRPVPEEVVRAQLIDHQEQDDPAGNSRYGGGSKGLGRGARGGSAGENIAENYSCQDEFAA